MTKKFITHDEFISLAFRQNNPNLQHNHAFLKYLFGSMNNVFIFQHLMTALAEFNSEEDTIIKTDIQFAREMGLSSKTIERSRKILKEAGFDIWVKKNAEGNPTNHYRFNLERFQAFVAAKLGVSADQVQAWMENPEDPDVVMDALFEQSSHR